ncbi:MAG TPA: PEP-CTERM sorting domain-containing protein, partial [Rhodanobacteraceae bacterium]
GNNSPFEFMTSADYFMVKVGAGPTSQAYALLHNLGGNLDLYFTATGQAGGLSHYITFDPVSGGGSSTPVPEPGILGMFGLGLLALGVGYGLRRRRAM